MPSLFKNLPDIHHHISSPLPNVVQYIFRRYLTSKPFFHWDTILFSLYLISGYVDSESNIEEAHVLLIFSPPTG